tara:strand:- start:40 stop:648 length:609 start_codon:yes stop_codon:yes gene_type:complete
MNLKDFKLIHFIWVGEGTIPKKFLYNLSETKKLNPFYEIKLWKDSDLIPLLDDFKELFIESSIFHKLQIARYLLAHIYGGIICDFDINWKKSFDTIYELKKDCSLILVKRNSLYFRKTGEKTTLLDDYVIIAKPGNTKEFLKFCLNRKDRKPNDETEPFSVYALTEWCIDNDIDMDFFDHTEIYDNKDSTLAVHENNKTWKV